MRLSLRVWRRSCQILVAFGFVLIPLLNMRGCTVLSGNLLSLDLFGVSFVDPLAFLQTLAGGAPAPRAAAGAALTLFVALLLGRVFCSWICPYGLASECCVALRGRQGAQDPEAAQLPASGARGPFSVHPFAVKATLAAGGLCAVLLFLPEALLNQLSMPGWYTRAMQHAVFFGLPLFGALCFVAALLLDAVSGRRFWCRFLCPQSVVLALCAALPVPGLRVRFFRKRCACPQNARPCLAACSLALNPRAPGLAHALECTGCGDCVDACRLRGRALRMTFF